MPATRSGRQTNAVDTIGAALTAQQKSTATAKTTVPRETKASATQVIEEAEPTSQSITSTSANGKSQPTEKDSEWPVCLICRKYERVSHGVSDSLVSCNTCQRWSHEGCAMLHDLGDIDYDDWICPACDKCDCRECRKHLDTEAAKGPKQRKATKT
jgi:hypothetical protein